MAAAGSARAAEEPADADAPELAEITVTATRSETLLSRTPITMTVLDSEAIRNAGVTDARALTKVVPNVSITGPGRIAIRGVTSTDGTEKGDPSAAFMLDGIYLSRIEDVGAALYDVGRIEVLRGPQGTLYGRNTTAGVINVISNRPGDELQVALDASHGSFGTTSATGVLNVPLNDDLSVRAAVNYRRQDAYYNIVNAPESTLTAYDALSGRLSFGGQTLSDRLSFVVIADASRDKGDVYNNDSLVTADRFFTNTATPGTDPTYISRSSHEQRQLLLPPAPDFPWFKDFKSHGIMADATYDFGPVQLSYLGSYREADQEWTGAFFFRNVQNPFTGVQDYFETSEELRLAFGADKPLHGQVGGYYFRESITLDASRYLPFGGFFAPGAIAGRFPRHPAGAESKAAFGQVTYDITPALHLTGGVRSTDDEKHRIGESYSVFTSAATIPPGTPNCTGNLCLRSSDIQSVSFSKTTWKAGVDYDSPLGLIYATVSTGYKAGGFNDGCIQGSGGVGCNYTPAQANLLYFQPETLTSYEAGIKFHFGSMFRFDAAAFHYDYNDFQVSQVVTEPIPGQRTTNAAKARVDGVELSTTALLSANDTIDATLNWLDARYTDFVPDPVNNPAFSFNGRQLDHAPRYSASFGYAHRTPLPNGGRLDVGLRVAWSDDQYMISIANRYQFRQPAYTKTDLNVTYNAPDGRYYVQAFARNLEDNITVGAVGNGSVSIQEPRVVGVSAGFKF